jgi:hypothetical protein
MSMRWAAARRWATRGLGWAHRALEAGREQLADGARTAAFVRGYLEFRPRPTDVYVATDPRSGTTWMQFLVYLLVSERTLAFDHISQVSPWFERSLALGTRTADDFSRLPSPRVFKSHLRPAWVPTPGRVIYVERDGLDVLVSYFHFYRSHLGFEGTFDEFYERFMEGTLQYRSWFDHVQAWRAAARDRSVLWVRYEEMKDQPETTIERVAEYLGRPVDAVVRAEIASMVAYDFMKAHESKFDPITEHLIDRRFLPGSFIRSGESGVGKGRLDARQIERFETRQRRPRKMRTDRHLADFLH